MSLRSPVVLVTASAFRGRGADPTMPPELPVLAVPVADVQSPVRGVARTPARNCRLSDVLAGIPSIDITARAADICAIVSPQDVYLAGDAAGTTDVPSCPTDSATDGPPGRPVDVRLRDSGDSLLLAEASS